jgi:hypothetical protein
VQQSGQVFNQLRYACKQFGIVTRTELTFLFFLIGFGTAAIVIAELRERRKAAALRVGWYIAKPSNMRSDSLEPCSELSALPTNLQ